MRVNGSDRGCSRERKDANLNYNSLRTMGFDLTTPSHVRLKSKVRNEDKAARTRGLNDDDVDRGTRIVVSLCTWDVCDSNLGLYNTIPIASEVFMHFCSVVQTNITTAPSNSVHYSRVILCFYVYIDRHTGRRENVPFLKSAIEIM